MAKRQLGQFTLEVTMSGSRTRIVATLACSALIVGAMAAVPAEAKKKKCAKYVPGAYAAEAELVKVTDKATADAPIEMAVVTDAGLGLTSADDPAGGEGQPSHKFVNIQIDPSASTANVFVRIEYTPTWDYDLFLRTAAGPAVAYEADFNPATAGGPTPIGGNETAHPEPGAGQIDGYTGIDCEGFTIDIASASTPGEEVALTIWLE
jgi:hypothetical protein